MHVFNLLLMLQQPLWNNTMVVFYVVALERTSVVGMKCDNHVEHYSNRNSHESVRKGKVDKSRIH